MLRPWITLGLLVPLGAAQEREPGPILAGTVTGSDGNPVAGVRVSLHGGLATRWKVAEASTDERGVYRFDPCNHGALVENEAEGRWDYSIGMQLEHSELVSRDGSWWWDVTVRNVDGRVTRQDFELVAGGRLAGSVVDELGKPRSLSLRLSGTGGNPYFRWIESDAAGSFAESGLFPGAYELDVNDPELGYPVIGRAEVKAGETTSVELLFDPRFDGEFPRRTESRYLILDGGGAGSVSLSRRSGVLSIDASVGGERREERIDLVRLVDPAFRPLCFECTTETQLTIAGVLATRPWETVLGELDWRADPDEPGRWRELYRGTGIGRPLAVDVLPGAARDLVVLDGDGPQLLVWERARHTLRTIATRQAAPGLERARFLRVDPLADSRGFVIRTCSVDARAENIPLITKPAYLYLRDDDGDLVIDGISPFGP